MNSLYWDNFDKRLKETVKCLNNNQIPSVRRVCIFITNQCNFRCTYCNMKFGRTFMSFDKFKE